VSTALTLKTALTQSINDDLAARTAAHQATMAATRAVSANLTAAGGPAPLVMLANGDSWFDYPLDGNDVWLGGSTDVIAQLGSMGAIHPHILSVAHWGEATTDELSLPKQERMKQALADPANWAGEGRPDAILFSGGGNDIAGDRFCIFLDFASPGASGLDARRLANALQGIEASYLALFAFRDRYAPNVPIFGHDYDFAIPSGVHPACTGPWVKPSLDYCGWTDPVKAAAIVRAALTAFSALLVRLSADPNNNFHLVHTQGTLAPADWANELHPTRNGFKAIADKFVTALAAHFHGRI